MTVSPFYSGAQRLRTRTLHRQQWILQRWVNSSLHPNHSDAELDEYERDGEIAYMDHKTQQAKAISEPSGMVSLDDYAPDDLYVDRLLELRSRDT